MKKVIVGLLIGASVLTAGVATASASSEHPAPCNGSGICYDP